MIDKLLSTAIVLSFIVTASVPAFAQADHEPGSAVIIPPYAMRDLLRCRHEQHPEQQCFARLSQEVESDHVVAENVRH